MGENAVEFQADLTARIERFIGGLERVNTSPSRGQTYNAASALAFLESGKFEDGHSAMDRAERDSPLPPEASAVEGSNQDFTAAQLRAAFHDVVGRQ